MSLIELIDNSKTDKNTVHSYIDLYEKLLCSQKYSAKNILEVGIYNGGSIKLWKDYFVNAQIHASDILHLNQIWDEIKNDDRITLHTSTDAYNDSKFKAKFLDTGLKFDFMLDDGPHTLDSMIKFIKLYSQIMTEKGILIIEDVQKIEWIDILKSNVSQELQQYIKVYDLRPNKNRYDDIVFTIDKQNI